MVRPRKWSIICKLPNSSGFGPLNYNSSQSDIINMTVDEYETIRLIDLEGLKQEECALRMNIARTTVQGIYIDARKKLADSLVNGKVLRIEGGNYEICNGTSTSCNNKRCHKKLNMINK